MKAFYTVLLIQLLSACATQQQKANLENVSHTTDGLTVISNHPEIINTYIKQAGTESAYCLEPDPDVVVNFGSSVSLGSSPTADKNISLSASQTGSSVTTGGLSPMVLIIREMLYRACELALNTQATKQESQDIYNSFLKTIETISKDMGTNAGTTASQSATQQ